MKHNTVVNPNLVGNSALRISFKREGGNPQAALFNTPIIKGLITDGTRTGQFVNQLNTLSGSPYHASALLSVSPNQRTSLAAIVDINDIPASKDNFIQQTHTVVLATYPEDAGNTDGVAAFVMGSSRRSNHRVLDGSRQQVELMPVYEGDLLACVGDIEAVSLVHQIICKIGYPEMQELAIFGDKIKSIVERYRLNANGTAVLQAFQGDLSQVVVLPKPKIIPAPVSHRLKGAWNLGKAFFKGLSHLIGKRYQHNYERFAKNNESFRLVPPSIKAGLSLIAEATILAGSTGILIGSLLAVRDLSKQSLSEDVANALQNRSDICLGTKCNNQIPAGKQR